MDPDMPRHRFPSDPVEDAHVRHQQPGTRVVDTHAAIFGRSPSRDQRDAPIHRAGGARLSAGRPGRRAPPVGHHCLARLSRAQGAAVRDPGIRKLLDRVRWDLTVKAMRLTLTPFGWFRMPSGSPGRGGRAELGIGAEMPNTASRVGLRAGRAERGAQRVEEQATEPGQDGCERDPRAVPGGDRPDGVAHRHRGVGRLDRPLGGDRDRELSGGVFEPGERDGPHPGESGVVDPAEHHPVDSGVGELASGRVRCVPGPLREDGWASGRMSGGRTLGGIG
ncbi:hypothetical protein [Kitasatospora sp. NPDC057738]|uniref:hypothetical protein n=1 Tax=Kitasatospora sp. NPDC057738 TaxID=3346233 RepID=UPI00368735FB